MALPPLKIPPLNDPLQGNATGTGAGVIGTSEAGNGVYGVSGVTTIAIEGPVVAPAGANGVYGASGKGNGVVGVNGAGSGFSPKFGCGVFGESDNGYGIYGASKTASGVYGTSGPGHLAGEFAGNVSVTGTLTANSTVTTFDIQKAGVCAQTWGPSPAVVAISNGSAPGILAVAGGQEANVLGVPNLPGLAAFLAGDVYVTGTFSNPNAIFSDRITANNVIAKDVTLSGNLTANEVTVTGKVTAYDVLISGADCAEQFDLKTLEIAEPGTVMVIDEDGALRQCERAYDRKVAGVVSGAGAFKPGIVLDQRAHNEGRTIIALVGKVYCKVDADASPVAVGDLLTTSDTPGHAMKVIDPLKGFGAVIGKALRPLESGRGLLPILVTLQ